MLLQHAHISSELPPFIEYQPFVHILSAISVPIYEFAQGYRKQSKLLHPRIRENSRVSNRLSRRVGDSKEDFSESIRKAHNIEAVIEPFTIVHICRRGVGVFSQVNWTVGAKFRGRFTSSIECCVSPRVTWDSLIWGMFILCRGISAPSERAEVHWNISWYNPLPPQYWEYWD